MGLLEQYAAHLRERDAQFHETHLGAARDDKIKKIIAVVSQSFLGMLFIARMAFCFWAMHENI